MVMGVSKILDHFFWIFSHIRLFESAGRKNSVKSLVNV